MANNKANAANAQGANASTSNGTKTEVMFAATVASVKTIDNERGFLNISGVPTHVDAETNRNYFGEYGMYCTTETLAAAIRRSYPEITHLESDYSIRRNCRYTFDNYAYLIGGATIAIKATCYPKGSTYENADGETVTRDKDRWYLNIIDVAFCQTVKDAYLAKVKKLSENMF